MKIKKLSLSKLLLLEVARFVSEVTRIVGQHAPETLHLSEMHKLLLEHQSKIKHINPPYGKHPLTETIERLNEKRLSYAAHISMELRFMAKEKHDDKQDFVNVAYPVMKRFLPYIREKKRDDICQIILIL